MSTLKQFFQNVWFANCHLSKKAYTTGLIVFSGTMAVAVITIGSNGYTGSINVAQGSAYVTEEEDQVGIPTEDLLSDVVVDEGLSLGQMRWTKSEIQMKTVATTDLGAPKLAKEQESEKNLKTGSTIKTSGNISNKTSQLLSARDYTALIKIVEAEATDEDLEGKTLIANVVMNRVASSGFPNNIYEVVHQEIKGRAQFSPIDDGRYYTVPVTASTKEAVSEALSGADYSEGALFFVAKSLASEHAGSWFDTHLVFIKKHGVHSFYK